MTTHELFNEQKASLGDLALLKCDCSACYGLLDLFLSGELKVPTMASPNFLVWLDSAMERWDGKK